MYFNYVLYQHWKISESGFVDLDLKPFLFGFDEGGFGLDLRFFKQVNLDLDLKT